MRLFACLMFGLSIGFGTYAGGAVLWSLLDPEGAGHALLLTLPLALAAAIPPALIGTLAAIANSRWEPQSSHRRTPAEHLSAAPAAPRKESAIAIADEADLNDLSLAA